MRPEDRAEYDRQENAARAKANPQPVVPLPCPTCEHLSTDKNSRKSRCYLCPFHHRKPAVAPEPIKSTAPAGVCPACWGFGKSIPVSSGVCPMCAGKRGME